METFSRHLTDDEVKRQYILLPKGKEKIFPREPEFDVAFDDQNFKAFVLPIESKAMGQKKKVWEFHLKFRDPQPSLFHFHKILHLESEDGNHWIARLE